MLKTTGAILAAATTLATPAMALDYFEVLAAMEGQTYAIAAVCPGGGDGEYSMLFEDADDTYSYVYVYPPEDTDDEAWQDIVSACNDGDEVELLIEARIDTGVDPYFYFAGPVDGEDTTSVYELSEILTEQFSDVTTASGNLDFSAQDLTAAYLDIDGYSKLVFFSYMAPRTTIDFLNQCFETCEYASFSVEPPIFGAGGLSVLLYAQDWSLDAPEPGEISVDEPAADDGEESSGGGRDQNTSKDKG